MRKNEILSSTYISNHYRCKKCYSEEYIIKTFKKVDEKWVRCNENEAEIGMEVCNECNCDQRVHESYFVDKSYKDGKRPYIYRFRKKVKNGWVACRDNENILLYNNIYHNIY